MAITEKRFSAPIIKTKLAAPQLRADLVVRPNLLGKLGEVGQHPFTLVCAPAGYGKSTILINWIANLKQNPHPDNPRICWLSLDDGDNEPIHFLSYLVASFETADASICKDSHSLLLSNTETPPLTIFSVLINDLEKIEVPICLVLDDYHSITNKAIHENMAFFLTHLPANVHLVMATRSDPPIPLARLRARREMIEIRALDLQFSYQEMECLFNQMMGLGLTPKDMARLEERTEGWIAGLQMAALAIKSISQTKPADIAFFISNFAGSNRYILDYLVEEVLNHQPKEIQDFLLYTSFLDTLSGPLCDAVTGIDYSEAEVGSHSSQSILEYLDRSNLFLVSLDPDRLWYRYHRLFADLLRAKLEQSAPQKVLELHKLASTWNEQNHRIPEAINHSLDAKDYGKACRLIELLVEDRMHTQNALSILWVWIRRLPPEIVITRPWLCIMQALSSMFLNDTEKSETFLKAAEQAIKPGDPPDLKKTWEGNIACQRAFIADIHNDVAITISMAHQALNYLHPRDAAARAFAKYMLGRAHFIQGDFLQSVAVLKENVQESIESNLTNIIAPSLSLISMMMRINGKLRESVSLLAEGLAYIEQCDPRSVTVAGLAITSLANMAYELNDLDEAEKIYRRSLELSAPWANPSATCGCYMLLARLWHNQGKVTAAAEAIHLAEEAIRGHDPLPEVTCGLIDVRVKFWLGTGQLSKASQWAQDWQQSSQPEAAFTIPKERDEINLARVLIAEGRLDLALQTLERLAGAAESAGRLGNLIEIRNLQAIALQVKGHQKQAMEILRKSLALGKLEGHIRTYVDEGEPLRQILRDYLRISPESHSAYVQKLLAAYNVRSQASKTEFPSANLIESLTAREMDILQTMAEGLSNHQIADKLFLAEGTVKFYVHSVMEKLGVHNRTQAVLEAKKLQLI